MEHPPEVWSIPPGTPCIYVEVFHYHYSGVAGGESQSPPPTPPPQRSTLTDTQYYKIIKGNTRNSSYADRNKQINKNEDE